MPHSTRLILFTALFGLPFTVRAASFTWGGGDSAWTNTAASGWNGGPPASGDSGNINSGTVAATTNNQQGGVAITVGGAGVFRSAGYFVSPGNLVFSNGGTVSLQNTGHYANYGGGWLPATVSVKGSAASGSFLAGDANHAFWNLTDGTTFSVADVSGDANADLTISAGLKDAVGSPDTTWTSSGIVKTGPGTMKLTAVNTYSGGTTVNGGTLELNGASGGIGRIQGTVTVNAGTTLALTAGDGTGFGWSNTVSSLIINGGTVNASGGSHLGFGAAATVVLSNGGTIAGNWQWNGDGLLGFSSSGDSENTISGSLNLRSDAGANHTFNVADGAAATDLRVSGDLTDSYPEVNWLSASNLVKTGSGTMLVSGNNSYDGITDIVAGTLVAAHNNALGAGGHNGATMTFIRDGATLALSGGISSNEHFHFWGTGVGGLGSLRSLSGDNALTDSYVLRSNVTVGVDAGSLTVPFFYESGGSFALTKTGTGKLTLGGVSSHTGGTTVNGGTLELSGATGGNGLIRGALTVNAGTTVNVTGDDGTGLGWNDGAKVTALTINGGMVTSSGAMHVWSMSGGVSLTGGTLQASPLQWGDTVVNTNASDTTSVIGGQINIRADNDSANASLLQLNVADGAAATDLLISADITQSGLPVGATTGGRCGITKTGAGTLRLTGAVQITGVISVEAGTLDFAASAVNTNARISVASNARLLLSNAATNLVKNVFIDGVKLAAGRWGAPGSVAAGTADFESPVFGGAGVVQVTDNEPSGRERWKRMKYGQFTHYVWNGSGTVTTMPDGTPTPSQDYIADHFDAAKYADDLQSMGVEYVIFTAWHMNFCPLFNSAAFDRDGWGTWHPRRDMLGDMVKAVRAKGIRVLFYTHPNQPHDWSIHNQMINNIYAELLDRYGDQIDGLYMDENNPGGDQDNTVDFVRLGQTIRRRNPDLILIQNFYGNLYCNDVPMGESGPASPWFSKDIAGASVSSYAQVMSNSWSAQVPVTQYAATRSPEGIFRAAVMAAGSCTEGGGTAWAAGPFPGGIWEQGVLETMQGAGQLMAPVAEAVKNTYPSTSWPTFGGFISSLPNGMVATRSVDDTKEYIHVLNPPGGSTLTIPAPADGKVFANARLLVNGNAVTLVQNSRAVQLTLSGTDTWDINDTVIVMDVVSSGDIYLANDTSPEAAYTGSWTYQQNRATTEFKRDVHETTVNGAFVEFAFNGTDIELFATAGSDRGTVDIFMDGVFQQTVTALSAGTQYRKAIYRQTGLPRGNHKLKAVKTGGARFTVDAFRASELIDSTDPSIAYQGLTFFNNTATTPNPVGYIEYGPGWSWQQRDRTEYNYDAHWAQWNGSTFYIHFNGTGVQFIGTYDGIIDFYIDDVFVKRATMGGGGMSRVLGLDLKGLPAGNHVLKGMKVGDTYALVDAFFVYNSANSSWSTQADSLSVSNSHRRSYAYTDVASVPFQGTGIEVIAPHSSAGGTVAVSISAAAANLPGAAYQGVTGQFVNQYAAATQQQSVSFASRNVANLASGDYILSMSHNRSFGSIALDAFRVYKNKPNIGVPYDWGATGGGGSGTWNVNATSNWWDGASATPWFDAGGVDYAANFGGSAGNVSLAANINVNRMTFNTTGYALTNGSIHFNGYNPGVTVASNVVATVGSPISGSVGMIKDGAGTLKLTGVNSFSGATIDSGTLELNGATGGNGLIRGVVAVNPGATLAITGGDGTGFGWNNSITSLTVNGGTVNTSGGSHFGFGNALSVSLTNGAEITGGTNQWNGDGLLTFSSSGDSQNTISSSLNLRTDAGANHTFNVADGTAATDLLVSGTVTDLYPEIGWLAPAALVKTGAGTMVLTRSNSYNGATTVNAGTLQIGDGAAGSIAADSAVSVGSSANLALKLAAGGTFTNAIVNNGTVSSVSANTQTFSGIISGAGNFVKSGAGTTFITGTNACAGGTTVNAGTLSLGNGSSNSNLADTAAVSVAGGATLHLNYSGTDTVSALSFAGIARPPGVYSAANSPFITGPGTLTVSTGPATDFAGWAAFHAVTGSQTGDDDQDGLNNLTEYAFSLNPKTGGSSGPYLTLPNPGSRTFTYIRRRPSLTGLNYTVWTSKNLSEWTEDTTATQTATDIPSTDNQSVEVFLNPALLSSNRLFLRVQAQ